MGSRVKATESTAAEEVSPVAASTEARSAEATRRLFLRLAKATPGAKDLGLTCVFTAPGSL